MTHRKKLIEVALPLEAINEASAREKSIRHGHPSTLHLWWARRPLAAARAVIFASLVDDPDDPSALPAFVEACRKLPKGKNVDANGDTPRMRLFDFIERLVTWEATTDDAILNTARELIMIATEGHPPPLLDPFAGGGSIPLEAQRLGLEAHASDLNPVAVMINKAQIEIPPRFANMPPVNPRDRALTPQPPLPQQVGERGSVPPAGASAPQGMGEGPGVRESWHIPPSMRALMTEIARNLHRNATKSEDILWQALRNRQLDGKKFKRQVDIGPFVLDFYCAEERLAVEVDGSIHALQVDADKRRQELIESLGIRFVRVSAELVESDLQQALAQIRAKFGLRQQSTLPLASQNVGEGARGDGHLWRGAAGLAADVRYYGEWMRDKAWERIGHLYPTHNGETVIAWLWARTVKCPNPACSIDMPLLSSFVLSSKKGKESYLVPVIKDHQVTFEVSSSPPKKYGDPKKGLKRGMSGIFECVNCGNVTERDYVANEGINKRIGSIPTAIVLDGNRRRDYVSVSDNPIPATLPEVDISGLDSEFPANPRDLWCRNFGLTTPADLFTPRQLVALTTFSDLVAEARQQAYADALAAGLPDDGVPLRDGGRGALAYAEAVSVYLAFAVDKLADYDSALCSWHSGRDTIRNTFGRQALPMVWDYAEANPFSDSTGNWSSYVEWIWKVIENLPANLKGWAVQQDAASLNLEAKTLSTDPPYYDNIGYADLSDFFYVWMRKALRDVYPDIFGTLLVPKAPELIASPYRHGGKEAANQHFEGGMLQTFRNIRRFITPDYPLTVYYAFKQQDAEAEEEDGDDNGRGMMHHAPTGKSAKSSTGWETMLTSLIDAGFSIDGTWPMRTELSNRMVGMGANALASSIVLVCRPRPEDAPTISRRAFLDALRRELPAALKAMQSGSIAPVDLAQASIGPGMAIYSRYSKVLEADGSPMSVRTALGLINAALDEYLAEQDGDIDSDTRFAVAWFEQFGFSEGDFGRADVLARAKNTSVAGVESAGLVVAGRGKVKLKHWSEYDRGAWDPTQDKRPTIWEATHHLIKRLNSDGETGSAELLQKMPSDMAAEARQLAYRLYSICERKGWAEHARDYNALVMSWSGIGEEAARLRDAVARGDATSQPRLFDDT
jgi:putative DNA methylase